MWVIRAYDPTDDELVLESELPGVGLRELLGLLNFSPVRYGSTELCDRQREALATAFGFPIVKGADYFLDFDADPESAEPHPEEAVPAWAW